MFTFLITVVIVVAVVVVVYAFPKRSALAVATAFHGTGTAIKAAKQEADLLKKVNEDWDLKASGTSGSINEEAIKLVEAATAAVGLDTRMDTTSRELALLNKKSKKFNTKRVIRLERTIAGLKARNEQTQDILDRIAVAEAELVDAKADLAAATDD